MNKLTVSCFTALIMILGSCKDKNKDSSITEPSEKITIEHVLGTSEVVPNPKNVVIMHYGIADTFDELGLPIKGMPKGIMPSYLKDLADDANIIDVGDIKSPNLEKINQLEPELIIISGRQSSLYEEFIKIAPTINLDVNASNFMESFKGNQRIIGKLFGKEAEVEKALKAIDERVIKINEKLKNSDKKGLIVLTNEGKMSVYGKGSRFGIIHDVLGLKEADEKIQVSTHGQSISNELIEELDPDYLFVVDRGAAIKRTPMKKEDFSNALIKRTKAYKNNKIIFLTPEIWYLSGGGLKSINLMLDEVEAAIE